MEMTQSPASPYLAIWIRPRQTIRQIVDRDPSYRVLFLVVLGAELAACWGFLSKPTAMVQMAPQVTPQMVQHALRRVSIAALVVSPLLAIISLYAGGALLRWAGARLGGVATSGEVRAAIAWSSIPNIVATVLTLVILATGAPTIPAPQDLAGLKMSLLQVNAFEVISLVLGIWGIVIWLKCLGEVHRFSAWRALGASAIAILIGVGIMLGLGIALMVVAFFYAHHS